MKKLVSRLISRLIGTADQFSFEHRILNFAFLLAIFMTFVGVVIGIITGVNWLFWVIADIIWIILFYQVRFKGHFKTMALITFSFLIFVFFPYSWIYNFGSHGVFLFYSVLLIAMIATVLTGTSRYVMVSAMMVVTLTLISLEYYYPDLIKGYESYEIAATRYMDITVNLMVCLFIISLLIIVYSNIYKKEKERSDSYARSIEEHYQQQLYYMENLEQLIYKLKSERHDFNHHLGVIYGLLEEDETAAVSEYTGKLVENAEEYQNIVNVPHSVLRAMLNYKLSAAQEEGIELKLKVKIPEELDVDQFELTIILGNLLDNAVEACLKIEETRRYIDLSVLYKTDYLVISIENPVAEEQVLQDGKPRTTKKDSENHGFGIDNIEYLVKKHDGMIKIEEENGIFKVDIAMLIGEGEANK